MKYKAFISYKHAENSQKQAEALERALKRYAKPLLKPPIKIFRDEKHMVPGEGLSQLIRNGLDNSEYLLFLAEKQAAQSKWCESELDYWCNTLKRKERLIIIHIGDQIVLDQENDRIDWQNTNALPAILRPILNTIPLYSDLSWVEKDQDTDLENIRYKSLINAIIAKFRGLTPEQINDEEVRVYRRNTRLRNGAITVLVILLVISVIATIVALQKTDLARENAAKEIQQRKIAEANLITAYENHIKVLERDSSNRRRLVELALNASRGGDAKQFQKDIDSISYLLDSLKMEVRQLENLSNL